MVPDKARPLIAMLASDNEGEVVNAARALKRVLASAQMDMNDLAVAVGNGAHRRAPCAVCATRARAERAARRSTKNAQTVAWLLDENASVLTKWEREFLESLTANFAEWGDGLTDKQQAILDRITAKARKANADGF